MRYSSNMPGASMVKVPFFALNAALFLMVVPVVGSSERSAALSTPVRIISFGTTLDPQVTMDGSVQLATSLANPGSSKWRAKGDQRRSYHFAQANADEPYRVCVPGSWDGTSKLPLAMFLHGAGSNESTYLDQNNKLMVRLAEEHGFLLVSPMGDKGAYGNFLRLTAPFGNEAGAAQLMAQVTSESERTNQLSEQDVINVLEQVLNEYPVDRTAMFLFGHSMGSGGTWYIGGKYRNYWKAIAPMSGPFVQEKGYPWDSLHQMGFFVTEGTQTPSLDGSRAVRDWMIKNGFKLKYEEVNADHGGMIQQVLPAIFEYFDSCKATVVTASQREPVVRTPALGTCKAMYLYPLMLRLSLPLQSGSMVHVAIFDVFGRCKFAAAIPVCANEAYLGGLALVPGVYQVSIKTSVQISYSSFMVNK